MFELEITILVVVISAVVGPLLVTRYRHYLNTKKVDPIKAAIDCNNLVEEQLEQLKDELDADRIWISQFHNGGNFYPTGKSIQKFSIFHEICSPGINHISETFKNIPVSLFSKSISHLYSDGEILIPNYSKEDNFGLATFTEGTNAKSSYLFALNSIKDEFIGTLGIEYCSRVKKLNEDQLNDSRTKSITIGTLLSTYLYEGNKK
jgi:hypothetical protein